MGYFLYLVKDSKIDINMQGIIIKSDFEKDLVNWKQAAAKKSSHGIAWTQYFPARIQQAISEGKTSEEIEKILGAFLKEKYAVQAPTLEAYAEHLQEVLQIKSREIFSKLEQVTEEQLYRDEFTGFITTLPRGPYSTQSGYIWFIYGKSDAWQIKSCIHELLHMQFEHYYKNRLRQSMSEEHFGFLRESMTVIINKEFRDLTPEIDRGYPLHQEFRTHLSRLWEQKTNFKEFVERAVRDLPKFITTKTQN